ncbi:MAG: N-acetylmuramoyl-L-alanine amidase [Aminipila sp.]
MIKINICIDAGHCKLTPGKRAFDSSFMEWEFNYDVACRIKRHLDRHGVNSYVQYVENANPKTELNARIKAVNKDNPTLVVSIHANAFGTSWNNSNGWEIFCSEPTNTSAKGTILAKAIQKYSKALGLTDRGIKDAHGVAGIVVSTTPPAVLIEHGFYTNQSEVAKLKANNFREQCAICDAMGILEYLGIAWKEESKMPETKKVHWAKLHLDSLVKKGVINNPEEHKDLDAPITKGQLFALLDRITK